MVSPAKVKRLRPSVDSPSKGLNLAWVPEGMDSSTVCRIDVRATPDVKARTLTADFQLVVDRDTINLKDLTDDVAAKVACGANQGLNLSYFNKQRKCYSTLITDSMLMDAIDMYWDLRRLVLYVGVYDIVAVAHSQSVSIDEATHVIEGMPLIEPPMLDDHDDVEIDPADNVGDDVTDTDEEVDSDDTAQKSVPRVKKNGKEEVPADDVPWEEDEEEYVGLNDENHYMTDLNDDNVGGDIGGYDSDCSDKDDLFVDDQAGCEVLEHVTNLDNPTIACGVTFEDGDTFKRAIRQYAVLKEFEIAALYSESTRYRGICTGKKSKKKKCKWRIHASQLQDGKTWQIKKMYAKHTCASTAKLDHNCMADNAWVRDRVIDTLRKDPTTGAAELKKELENKYSIILSYYVVWDGRQMALEEIEGNWKDSFDDAFRLKAEIERTNPGSIVEVEWEKVGNKNRFSSMFIALKPCVDGFLNGCRPFLGVDSTVLTGRWRGQLASASAVDGNNWLFPVAYGVFASETADSWKWFFQKLQTAIGSPLGLVISTDAGKGIDSAVTSVFSNGVEHRECMRYLVKNFQKRYRGVVFKKHLWPCCRAYNQQHYEYHYNIMKKASPNAIKWIEQTHKHLWNRWKFSHASKCDYVTNNIAETFNSWIRKEKLQAVIPLMDRIRQMIMEKLAVRRTLAEKLTDKIIPNITKDLNARSRNLNYVIHKGHNNTAEIQGTTKELKTWRHTVDLDNKTCSCQRWQITGLPCTHALCLINALRNRNMEDYIHAYYSVLMFKNTYEGVVQPMTDRSQWPQVDMGFKLWPPLFKRSAGRPRTRRLKGAEEGGTGTRRQMQCKRCGQFGHMMKTCNETVYDSDAPPPAASKPKKPNSKQASTVSTKESQIGGCTASVAAGPSSPATNTRSHKRALEITDGSSSPPNKLKKTCSRRTAKKKNTIEMATKKRNKQMGTKKAKKKLVMELLK